MDKNIRAVILFNKAISLLVAKPFQNPRYQSADLLSWCIYGPSFRSHSGKGEPLYSETDPKEHRSILGSNHMIGRYQRSRENKVP